MHGNVSEWCADWYGDYPSGAVTDPTGAKEGRFRVSRGGWSARRGRTIPVIQAIDIGFRLCLVSESQMTAAPQVVKPQPPQPPDERNDPKLVGKWEWSTNETYYFFDDGSFTSVYNFTNPYSLTVMKGKYTTSNGKVYLTNLVNVQFENEKYKDLIYEYSLGTDENGEYLWIPQFEQLNVKLNKEQSYSPKKFRKDKDYVPPPGGNAGR